MSNTARESGALNAFGDLSRRARRELEESGVNPEDARDQLLATGSIRLPTGSILTNGAGLMSAPAGGVIDDSAPAGAHDTSGLSRRELRALQERTGQVATPLSQPVGRTEPARFSLPTAPGAPSSDLAFGLSPALSDNSVPVENVIRHTTTPLDDMISQQALTPVSQPGAEPFGLSTQSTGVISTTSHALIIPSPPDPLSGPIVSLDQTGEVLLTGQIVLPASIGSTGADSGRLDLSEVDVIDYGSEIAPSQDLAPVRATSAVSATVTRGGAVTSPIKSRDRVPLALTVTATFLAVAVVGLFVAGYLLGVF